MKSQATTTIETVRQAIEAVRRDAGPQEVDQMTALLWLKNVAEREAEKLKKGVRTGALKQLKGDATKVPVTGRMGTTQVTFMTDSVMVRPNVPVDRLRQALGDRFSELFKTIPERIEPVPGFKKALEEFDGSPPVIDLVESAVSYSPRAARVSPPRAPKV